VPCLVARSRQHVAQQRVVGLQVHDWLDARQLCRLLRPVQDDPGLHQFNQVLQFPLSLAFSGAGCLSQKLLRVPPAPRAVPDWVPAHAGPHPGAAKHVLPVHRGHRERQPLEQARHHHQSLAKRFQAGALVLSACTDRLGCCGQFFTRSEPTSELQAAAVSRDEER
jgi:hypothetical protein